MQHKVQLGLMNVMSFNSIYLQTRRLIGRQQPWYLELCCNKQKNKNKKFIVWNLKFIFSENGFHAEGVDCEPQLGFYTILTEDMDDVLFPKSSPLIDLFTVF